MERKKRKSLILLLTLLFFIGFTVSSLPSISFAVSPMMEAYVPMRDGVLLHTFIYLPDPDAGWGTGPFPALISRTPYGIGAAGVLPGAAGGGAAIKTWKDVVAHGYAFVFQDTRGRYYSEGVDRLFADDAADGYDIVEWVAKQPWCNGKVGVEGSSASGITSYLAGALRPPHLKAIFAQAGSGNLLNDFTYQGQAMELGTTLPWIASQGITGLSATHIAQLGGQYATLRAQAIGISMDLMGHLTDAANSEWWMYLPLLNYPGISGLEPDWNVMLSHPNQDEYRNAFNTHDKIVVPTLHATAWYDCFLTGNLEAFKALQKRVGNQKIYILPGYHYNVYVPSLWPYDPFFMWFDYWLKGENTGIMGLPAVTYYRDAIGGWDYASEWPPKNMEYKTYYLHGNGDINTKPPAMTKAWRSYVYDPRDPVQTVGGRNLILPAGPYDQRPVEPPNRDDVLVYKTDPLTNDIEIAGNVKVTLHASSTCKDTDFVAKLIDVYPDGRTMLVLDGVLRAMYRESFEYPVFMHGEQKYEFTIDLGDISHLFKAGHRIQVDISSSNFPRIARNSNSGNVIYAADTEDDFCIAENTIFHNPGLPSYIVLPILP